MRKPGEKLSPGSLDVRRANQGPFAQQIDYCPELTREQARNLPVVVEVEFTLSR
jgi:hypothetical protein